MNRPAAGQMLHSALAQAAAACPNIQVRIVDRDYADSEPMLWRMLPLWDPDTAICHVRDIDSVPSPVELAAMRYFEAQSYGVIQSLRSHPNHNSRACALLGGLSAYNAQYLREHNGIPPSFQEFATRSTGAAWGADLLLLRRFFLERKPRAFRRLVLDTPLAPGVRPMRKYGTTYVPRERVDEMSLADIDGRFLDLLSGLTSWPGQPVDGRGAVLRTALSFDCPASRALNRAFEQDSRLRAFYLDADDAAGSR